MTIKVKFRRLRPFDAAAVTFVGVFSVKNPPPIMALSLRWFWLF